MQLVIFDFFYSHGLKGAKSNVQGDLGNFNSAATNLFQYLRCEVQAGRGRRHRPPRLSIHSLVAVAVRCAVVVATNVRRKWNVSNALDACEEIGDWSEADTAFTKTAAADNLGLKLGFDLGLEWGELASAGLLIEPPKRSFSPTPILRPGRTRHSHSLGSSAI